jgi:hypothetical protein
MRDNFNTRIEGEKLLMILSAALEERKRNLDHLQDGRTVSGF